VALGPIDYIVLERNSCLANFFFLEVILDSLRCLLSRRQRRCGWAVIQAPISSKLGNSIDF